MPVDNMESVNEIATATARRHRHRRHRVLVAPNQQTVRNEQMSNRRDAGEKLDLACAIKEQRAALVTVRPLPRQRAWSHLPSLAPSHGILGFLRALTLSVIPDTTSLANADVMQQRSSSSPALARAARSSAQCRPSSSPAGAVPSALTRSIPRHPRLPVKM